ncbi:MAG: leucine-rich repeat domain-containing protein [Acidobacteria bacterium]|nr:leucine-rich repeat domain-containing protein [Acidobacteriota bacterium]
MSDPTCDCFLAPDKKWREVEFHAELQDTQCDAWRRLEGMIEEAALDGRAEFAPMQKMTGEDVERIITLPRSIRKLRSVKHLVLYDTFLVRVPREIGEMSSLEKFTPYTSWRLHWLPYEITRCRNLVDSTVSTRCLYGNFKYRPPFPALPVSTERRAAITDRNLRMGSETTVACSVCDGPCTGPVRQAWISLLVATDVLPLLVNACSRRCLDALPAPPPYYLQRPHRGGLGLEQPVPEQVGRTL